MGYRNINYYYTTMDDVALKLHMKKVDTTKRFNMILTLFSFGERKKFFRTVHTGATRATYIFSGDNVPDKLKELFELTEIESRIENGLFAVEPVDRKHHARIREIFIHILPDDRFRTTEQRRVPFKGKLPTFNPFHDERADAITELTYDYFVTNRKEKVL